MKRLATRATAAPTKVTAAKVSNGWVYGTGEDIGAYVDRALIFQRTKNKDIAVYIALSEEPGETPVPRVEIFDQSEADVIFTADLSFDPKVTTSILQAIKKQGAAQLPDARAIAWLFSGKP